MNFLNKIENFINMLLIKLGELIWKLVPAPLKKMTKKFSEKYDSFIIFLKNLPKLIIASIPTIITYVKTKLISDAKNAYSETSKKALSQYQGKKAQGFEKVKRILAAPFLILAEWMSGLSPAQMLLLLTFTGSSFLAIIGIGFSGNKLVNGSHNSGASRSPASSEDIKFERPDYYKQQTRHLEFPSFRLNVYSAQVNEIKAVDIDFTITLSNRSSKMFLEKNYFPLLDHLNLQIEPMVASFTLEDEGKEIIRKKLISDINDFLKQNEIEGHVEKIDIVYQLAN